jgi:hypothetical protein
MLCRDEKQCALNDRIIKNGPQNENQRLATPFFSSLLGMTEPFAVFSDHVRAKFNAEPGFITMNLPLLLDALDGLKIDNPIVCSSINKLGFRMCGGLGAYEEALRERRFRAITMSVFASGAIPASETIAWVCAQPNVESILRRLQPL